MGRADPSCAVNSPCLPLQSLCERRGVVLLRPQCCERGPGEEGGALEIARRLEPDCAPAPPLPAAGPAPSAALSSGHNQGLANANGPAGASAGRWSESRTCCSPKISASASNSALKGQMDGCCDFGKGRFRTRRASFSLTQLRCQPWAWPARNCRLPLGMGPGTEMVSGVERFVAGV